MGNLSSPSYLVRQKHSYCFRMVVPARLRPVVGKTELRCTLRTGSLYEAKRRAMKRASFVYDTFAWIEANMDTNTLSQDQIQQLISEYFKLCIATEQHTENIQSKVEPYGFLALACTSLAVLRGNVEEVTTTGPLTEDPYDTAPLKDAYQEWIKALENAVVRRDYSLVEEGVARFLELQGTELDPQSVSYQQLLRGVALRCREIYKHKLDGLEGKFEGNPLFADYLTDPTPQAPQAVAPQAQQAVAPQAPQQPTSPTLSTLYADFVREKEAAESWTTKTKDEDASIFKLFEEFMGDIPVRDVTRPRMIDFLEALKKLPPHMNKSPEYRDKSLREVLTMKIDTPISVTTVNKYLRRISSFLDYARKNGHIEGNPGEGLSVKTKTRPDEERSAMTDDDLRKLFHSKEYLADGFKHPYQFWLPILAVFTGARLEELCQLDLGDVRQEGDLWVLDFNEGGDKRLKTNNSRRLIPLHPFIVERLNLPGYVEALKAKGDERLFPELPKAKDGKYHKNASRWFNETYKRKCGVAKGVVFHSFRHTFATALTHEGVLDAVVEELMGHARQGSETVERYAKRFPVQKLHDEGILKLPWLDRLDLEHLTRSRFVQGR